MNGDHFENERYFVRHFELFAGQRYCSKQLGILSLHAKFDACFTKCTIVSIICLAKTCLTILSTLSTLVTSDVYLTTLGRKQLE